MAARTLEQLAIYDHNHPGRDKQLPYIWHIIHESGASTYGRTSEKKPSLQTWSRIGSQDGIGRPVRWQIVPNEVALHKFKEVQNTHNWTRNLLVRDEPETKEDNTLLNGNYVAIRGEGAAEVRVFKEVEESPVKDPDIEADEELVNLIAQVHSSLDSADMVIDFTRKAMDRFFSLVADSDGKDPDQAEELALLARLHQKKFARFNDAINDAELAFEKIIENLEGA